MCVVDIASALTLGVSYAFLLLHVKVYLHHQVCDECVLRGAVVG
jgi:hypothetical protein